MRIAVCDDDKGFTVELERKLYEYSNAHNWEPFVEVFHSGYDLLDSDRKYDLIIMDHQMEGLTGLETSKLLRQGENVSTCIIFLTSFPEVALPAYDVDTFRFVVKSALYDGLYKALDAFREMRRDDYPISVKADGEKVTLDTADIVFVEAQNKDIFIHLSNGKIVDTKTKLQSIFKELPHTHFCKVHKSYIVNFQYISHRCPNEMRLRGTTALIPISRNYKQEFNSKYNNYLRDQ